MIERIKKYLPEFIQESQILNSLLGIIADSLLFVSNSVISKIEIASERETVILSLNEFGIEVVGEETDEDLNTQFRNRFSIAAGYGTEQGISDYLGRQLGAGSFTVNFFHPGNSGIILDNNFIGISEEAVVDGWKLLSISEHLTEAQRKYFSENIIPVDVQIL